mgnify:CR=1 FL=1
MIKDLNDLLTKIKESNLLTLEDYDDLREKAKEYEIVEEKDEDGYNGVLISDDNIALARFEYDEESDSILNMD